MCLGLYVGVSDVHRPVTKTYAIEARGSWQQCSTPAPSSTYLPPSPSLLLSGLAGAGVGTGIPLGLFCLLPVPLPPSLTGGAVLELVDAVDAPE